MLIVADTSALLALAVCECLPVLDILFQAVRVPPAVFAECTVADKPQAEELRAYLANRITGVEPSALVITATGLGTGELEAMALYKQLNASRLLVDDDRARRVAVSNHIDVVGSIGVLLLAKTHALIPAVRPRLESMRAGGIHVSDALVREAVRLADEA